jgi:hypothetical protein
VTVVELNLFLVELESKLLRTAKLKLVELVPDASLCGFFVSSEPL